MNIGEGEERNLCLTNSDSISTMLSFNIFSADNKMKKRDPSVWNVTR